MSAKIPLLSKQREWGVFVLLMLMCATWRLWGEYREFEKYLVAGKQEIQASVLLQYLKKNYWVLKLRTQDGRILYTTSKEDLKDLTHRKIRIYGKPLDCQFWQSLRSCFFVSYSIALMYQSPWQKPFYDFVASQHQDSQFSSFYQTLFFATTLPKQWREVSNALQISHLLAISGLHLGILWAMFYGILYAPYFALQRRFFTYRNRHFDLGWIALCLLGFYLVLLEFQPSFLRAFVMCALGLWLAYWSIELVSFAFLGFCMGVILALFPHLVLSVGFWFSCLGVFLILEFFRHFRFNFESKLKKTLWIAISLNTMLFFLMMPFVLFVFPYFSPLGVLSIPLSVVFPVFFVFVLVLHCFGLGGVGDPLLAWVLNQTFQIITYQTPLWFLVLYGILVVLGMRYKLAFCLTFGVSLLFWLVGVWRFFW